MYGETRFSSHSAFLKWKGDGYGDSWSHCDQTALPYPWKPDVAYIETLMVVSNFLYFPKPKKRYPFNILLIHTLRSTVSLTTQESGPLAVVPKSHLLRRRPVIPDDLKVLYHAQKVVSNISWCNLAWCIPAHC